MKLEALSQSDIGYKSHIVLDDRMLSGHSWNIDNDMGVQERRIERVMNARIWIDPIEWKQCPTPPIASYS